MFPLKNLPEKTQGYNFIKQSILERIDVKLVSL